MALDLDKRWGSLDWWFCEELAQEFYAHTEIRDGNLILNLGRNISKVINREYISRSTRILLNIHCDPLVQMEFHSCKFFNDKALMERVAPYRDDNFRQGGSLHERINQGAILAKGLQENHVLVGKWFISNRLGMSMKHLIDGKVV